MCGDTPMPKGVRGSRQALIKRFGIGERLAVRAVALQTMQVEMSAAVLESATPGSALERVLLDSRILSQAAELDTQRIRQVEREVGGQEPVLAVQCNENWRTIVLQEELVAEQALAVRPAEDFPAVPARIDPFQLVDASEVAELFTPAEISELKVTLLTSADPREKISALRKLLLSSSSLQQKGMILIAALSDSSAEVRAEAAAGMTRLGLNAGIADASQALAVGTIEQRAFAAGELGRLVHLVKEAELPVLLTVLASALESEKELPVRRVLISAARECVPYAARQVEHARELARILVRQVRIGERSTWPELRSVVIRLAQAASGPVSKLLHDEINKAPEGSVRRFLLTLLGGFALPPGMDRTVAELIAAEAARGDADELELQSLTDQMAMLGEVALGPLHEWFEQARAERRPAVARMIDAVCARPGVSAEAKSRAAMLFARALQTADRHLRATLLDTVLPADAELSEVARAALAEEFLASLSEFRHPRVAAQVEVSVARMGLAAVGALLKRLRPGEAEREVIVAARSLALLVSRLPEGDAQAEKAARESLEKVMEMVGRTSGRTRGELVRAAGRIASSPATLPSQAEALAREFRASLRDADQPFAMLEAMAQLALHPHVPLQMEIEVAQTLLGLLQQELPELMPQGQPLDQGVLEIGPQASVYTEMIPILLQGLQEIYLKTRSAQLRERIAELLLAQWHEASEWRLLWGPGNTMLLLEALGRLGTEDATAETVRLQIAEALARRIDFPAVVRALGNIFRVHPSSHSLGVRAAQVTRQLLSRLAQRAAMSEDEVDAAFEALGKIGARQRLGSLERQASTMRQEILDSLLEGLREGWRGAASGLRVLAESGVLSEDAANDVRTRLSDYFKMRVQGAPGAEPNK